jgi:hypothetical protein
MWRRLAEAVLGLALWWGLAGVALAQGENSAADIKTAFIYNFAKFVEWPSSVFAEPQSPLQLCVWGQALEGRLQLLNGREAQGHPIRVRTLDNLDSLPGCHILVVGGISEHQRSQLLQALGRNAVLTIGDSGDFTLQGGMIGLFVAANRVQFSVNLNAAHGAGLKISARMLQLAHSVRGNSSP